MNIKRLVSAIIAAFITIFIFEMLWHGFLMKGMYDETLAVWRPENEHNMSVMFLSQFLFAAVFVLFYAVIGKYLSCKIGLVYGFFAGLLLAMPQLGSFCYLPIPLSISLLWMLAALLKCIFAGLVTALIYKFPQPASE
ncbi:MAG: hypothetical protein HRU15_01165 [Planctomycetes bacterium]|nr:hypothetical protein [Planctomycetota bacterium]